MPKAVFMFLSAAARVSSCKNVFCASFVFVSYATFLSVILCVFTDESSPSSKSTLQIPNGRPRASTLDAGKDYYATEAWTLSHPLKNIVPLLLRFFIREKLSNHCAMEALKINSIHRSVGGNSSWNENKE